MRTARSAIASWFLVLTLAGRTASATDQHSVEAVRDGATAHWNGVPDAGTQQRLFMVGFDVLESVSLGHFDQPISKATVIKALGPPVSANSERFRNEDGEGYMTTLTYDGLVIVFESRITDPDAKACAVDEVTVTSPQYRLPTGLHVGMPLSDFLAAFSPAKPESSSSEDPVTFIGTGVSESKGLTYGGNFTLSLVVDQGSTVSKIKWKFWGD